MVIGCLSSTMDDEELETAGMTVIRVGLGVTADLEQSVISGVNPFCMDHSKIK